LKSERYNKGDTIAKAGTKPDCVLFIMNGVVKNLNTGRYFESGQMINHDMVLLKSNI
jgi:hypothetical protein